MEKVQETLLQIINVQLYKVYLIVISCSHCELDHIFYIPLDVGGISSLLLLIIFSQEWLRNFQRWNVGRGKILQTCVIQESINLYFSSSVYSPERNRLQTYPLMHKTVYLQGKSIFMIYACNQHYLWDLRLSRRWKRWVWSSALLCFAVVSIVSEEHIAFIFRNKAMIKTIRNFRTLWYSSMNLYTV
jgi:hypothetical protein